MQNASVLVTMQPCSRRQSVFLTRPFLLFLFCSSQYHAVNETDATAACWWVSNVTQYILDGALLYLCFNYHPACWTVCDVAPTMFTPRRPVLFHPPTVHSSSRPSRQQRQRKPVRQGHWKSARWLGNRLRWKRERNFLDGIWNARTVLHFLQ